MAFPGASFSLESVTQNGIASIRVRFTQDPRRVGDGDLTDALTPGNYQVTGPSLNYVVSGSSVFDDPQAVDLYLAAPLATGTWSLTVANAESDTGTSLVPPTSLTFVAAFLFIQEPLSGGAKNDSTENLIRKFLNPALKGKGWSAYVAGLAAGDRLVHDNARLGFDQVFLSSAKGRYLERRASDRGVTKPHNVGMVDDSFRELAIVQSNKKVVPEAVLEVLEIFYGEEAIRAYATTDLAEPYKLNDSDDLTLVFNGTEQYTINFYGSNFERIGAAKAIEVASVITRQLEDFGSQAYAVAYLDKSSSQSFVRVFSGRRGVGSSVQVVGGRAQLGLRFPQSVYPQTLLDTTPPPYLQWVVGPSPISQSRIRFQITVPASDPLDFNLLHEGDIAYVYGLGFDEVFRGSYEVKAVGLFYSVGPAPWSQSWFEVENPEGSAYLNGGSASCTPTTMIDVAFFRPVRSTTYSDSRRVTVNQQAGRLGISMPATSQLVTRVEEDAAYLNDGRELSITGVTRYGSTAQFTTALQHGLSVGDFIDVQGVAGSDIAGVTLGSAPGGLGGFPSTVTGETNACRMSIGSVMACITRKFPVITKWADGVALLVGGETGGADNLAPALLQITGNTPTANGTSYAYQWDALNLTLDCGTTSPGTLVLSDGSLLAYGGRFVDGTYAAGSLLQHDAGWNVSAAAVTGPLLQEAGLVQAGNEVFLLGGLSVAGSLADVSSMLVGTTAFGAVGSLLRKRSAPGACTLPDGKILVIGGYSAVNGVRASCEVYDPGTGTSTLTGSMANARFGMTVVQISNGRVLVLGGSGGPVGTLPGDCLPLKSCEMYDPATGRWSSLPDLYVETSSPAAVHFPTKNAVYVAFNAGMVQYLDCSTFTWHKSYGGNLGTTVFSISACALRDDVLVLVGGDDINANGALLTLGEERFSSEGLNTRLKVSSVGSVTTFSAVVEGSGYFTSASQEATATTTKAGSTCVGPYLFDPTSGFAITGTVQATGQVLNEATGYATLQLDTSSDSEPALDFPDTAGWLVFSFGDDRQVGPVEYYGREGVTALRLDASFKFPTTLPALTSVTLVLRTAYTQPEHAFWLTDSPAGRLAAVAALGETVACGVNVELDVQYPDDQGLGNADCPVVGAPKLADKVWIWGGNAADNDLEAARNS